MPPTHASMEAPALNWLVASPAAVLLVGLDLHANGTLMSVPAILAGVQKSDIRVYFLSKRSQNNFIFFLKLVLLLSSETSKCYTVKRLWAGGHK